MLNVKVSPKYQIVIPKEIRESMLVFAGQRMQVIEYENRIELIPQKEISELKGFLKGINTNLDKESDRV